MRVIVVLKLVQPRADRALERWFRQSRSDLFLSERVGPADIDPWTSAAGCRSNRNCKKKARICRLPAQGKSTKATGVDLMLTRTHHDKNPAVRKR